jgi:hypothetical protein
MIGSLVVAGALALASPDSRSERKVRVHVPEVEVHVPEMDLDMPDVDFDMPDVDVEVDLSSLDEAMRGMDKGMRALDRSMRRMDRLYARADRDQDEDEDNDEDQDVDAGTRERRRFHFPRFNMRSDESERGTPTARSGGKNAAALQVKGPVTFRLYLQSGESEIVATDKQQIAVSVSGSPVNGDVQILQFNDHIEARFNNSRALRRGKLRVELPKGSSVDINSTSGDVVVQDLGGDVRIRTMSGDVKVLGARKVDLQSISGDAQVTASGPSLKLHTVSGKVVATSADPAVQLDFNSASGDLDWTGVCGKGCHLTAETVSGSIRLQPDPAKSSFEVSYASHSGDFHDEMNLNVKRSPKRKHGGPGGWLEAVYGKGEGLIECDAFSGDLSLGKKQ